MSTARLLIVDHAPTRLGIKLAVAEVAEVCAETGDAQDAIAAAERTQPDVCIVGLEIAGGGLSAIRRICSVAPETKVVAMAASPDPADLVAVIRSGAIGYLSGSTDPAALRRVVLAAANGEAAIPRSLVIELTRELQDAAGAGARLTPRAAQVLALLREGHSTAAIAESLGISPVTVRRHISILKERAGVDTRAGLSLQPDPA